MADQPHLTYKTFFNREAAEEVQELLNEHGIESKIIENFTSVSLTFLNNPSESGIQLAIQEKDFEKANDLLNQLTDVESSELNGEHYLHSFTDEELYDILAKPDEWNEFDYNLAIKLLSERGKDVNETKLIAFKQKRVEDLAEVKRDQNAWVIIGYFFAFIGGLVGIAIGWSLWKFKKTLPDGGEVYVYNDRDRKHGRRMFIIGIIVLISALIFKLFVGKIS
ncbi:hypothetical protein [Olivibacter domesticus]|uniref:Signal transducing protein n=1 Tax=Olivibacter domesticus TaxID=407022 RepID=A0A1H7WQC4_OLID1|nr:hypothetical protein [Olivibacter domesticus]SEM23702.1 hypothetical protein SAMN05661044_04614 [Olivibacter domesticus]